MATAVNPVSYEAVDPRAAGSTWTGGQYSLVRALFGAWLFFGFVRLLPWNPQWFGAPADSPEWRAPGLLDQLPNLFRLSSDARIADAWLVLGAVASVFFALGAWHRVAGGLIAYYWICISTGAPRVPTPGMPWILVLLVAHLLLPPAPYGSWVARGRADPEGAWRMHLPVFQLAWFLLLLGSAADVFDKVSPPVWRHGSAAWRILLTLGIPIEAAVVFGVFKRRTRAISWGVAFAWRLLVLVLGGADERLRGLLVVHLYSFDPIWLPALRSKTREHLFFDGTCGLCHRLVRFVAAEDRGSAFFYSPLQGETIVGLVPEPERAHLPDSVVIRNDDGRLLMKSDATAHVLRRLGGVWRAAGAALAAIPRPLRDGAYEFVARVRKKVFKQPEQSCPLLSSRLRTYFLP